MESGNNLSSRSVARRVLSAQLSLTSVFGMRTGGTSALSSPQWIYKPQRKGYEIYTIKKIDNRIETFNQNKEEGIFDDLQIQTYSQFYENKPSTY